MQRGCILNINVPVGLCCSRDAAKRRLQSPWRLVTSAGLLARAKWTISYRSFLTAICLDIGFQFV